MSAPNNYPAKFPRFYLLRWQPEAHMADFVNRAIDLTDAADIFHDRSSTAPEFLSHSGRVKMPSFEYS